MATLINLTPHAIDLVWSINQIDPLTAGAAVQRTITRDYRLSVPPSGTVARVAERRTDRSTESVWDAGRETSVEVPLVSKSYDGDITGLPPGGGLDTIYIVSALVAQAAWSQGRIDVACPGDPVRDADGRIIGCAALCIAPAPRCGICDEPAYIYPGAPRGDERCGSCIEALDASRAED